MFTKSTLRVDPQAPPNRSYFRAVPYPTKYHKHPRLPGHDYTHGAYFITICTDPRTEWFGCIVGSGPDAVMEPNELGQIVLDDWDMLPERMPHVRLDQVQLMPDHFHGIIVLDGSKSTSAERSRSGVDAAGGRQQAGDRPNGPLPGSLGAIIGAFKSGTTIRMNRLRDTRGQRYWQKGFHDWRIRPTHAGEFERIAHYIATNPVRWP